MQREEPLLESGKVEPGGVNRINTKASAEKKLFRSWMVPSGIYWIPTDGRFFIWRKA